MRKRKQAGQIVTIGDAYYVRYWQRSNVGGEIVRKRCSRRRGEIPKGYRSKHPPDDVLKAAEEVMKTVTDSPIPAGKIISLTDFAELTAWRRSTIFSLCCRNLHVQLLLLQVSPDYGTARFKGWTGPITMTASSGSRVASGMAL